MYFIKCNNISTGEGNFFNSETEYLENLKKSIESGLEPDENLDIFVKVGYGALVGFCPSSCETIDQLLNYSFNNSNNVNKNSNIPDYFGYKGDISSGADLVIGPGCSVRGKTWEKAVYCRNYKEILMKNEFDKNPKQNILKFKAL